jgi:hypothetical protein
MLSSLPKLIGRGFVLGFLLPSILFCLYLQALAINLPGLSSLVPQLDAVKLTPVVLLSLVLAVLLMAVNRMIVRALEGYGDYNPLRILMPLRLRYFREKIVPLFEEAVRVDKARKTNPGAQSSIAGFPLSLSRATEAFPDREDRVLPTKFGNTMRAFEVYSRALYGLDAIPAWPRLFLVLPQSMKDQIRDSRAMLDFNANLFVLSTLAIIMTAAQMYVGQGANQVSVAIAFPVVGAVYAWMALPQGAHQWGEIVKSAFDLYRHRLAKELGLDVPSAAEDERRMWRQVSRMMIFRSPSAIDQLDEFRRPKLVSKRVAKLTKVSSAPPTGNSKAAP